MRKCLKNNKKAFTLVELMLAIAIIMLISGLFVSLIVAIRDSYFRTYDANDATDYAALYSQALENAMLKDAGRNLAAGNSVVYSIRNSDSAFLCNGSPMFDLAQMKNRDGIVKWRIYFDEAGCKFDANTRMVYYRIVLVSNYSRPNTIQLTYDGAFWLPNSANVSVTVGHVGSVSGLTYPNGSSAPSINCATFTLTAAAAS